MKGRREGREQFKGYSKGMRREERRRGRWRENVIRGGKGENKRKKTIQEKKK